MLNNDEIDEIWDTLTEAERADLKAEHNEAVEDEAAEFARYGGEL